MDPKHSIIEGLHRIEKTAHAIHMLFHIYSCIICLQESKKPPNKKKNNSSTSLSSLNSSSSLKDLQTPSNESGASESNNTGASGNNSDFKSSGDS